MAILKLKNAVTKRKNFAMYSIIEWKGQRKNNKWTETKRWKLTKPEQQRKNKLEKKKNRASESCRTVTRDLNVRVISISGREEKEDRAEKEIVPEIFPTLSKDTQETQQISVRMNPKKFTPRHIKVRLQKTEANFKKCWQQQEKHDILPVGEQFELKQISYQ